MSELGDGSCFDVQPVATDVPDAAYTMLEKWLQGHSYEAHDFRDWTRWEYCDPGLWTVFVFVWCCRDLWTGFLGMNIYDDGRIVCVSKQRMDDLPP